MKLFRAKWIGPALAVGLLATVVWRTNWLAPPMALGQFWAVTLQVEATALKYPGFSVRVQARLPDGRLGWLYAGTADITLPQGTLICVHASTPWIGSALVLRRLPDGRCGVRPAVLVIPAP